MAAAPFLQPTLGVPIGAVLALTGNASVYGHHLNASHCKYCGASL
jgi:hypothetical protein